MNTGIGMAISFIIGGLLLISIITLNSQVIENSGETTLNMTAKKTVETVTQVMTRDMLRIGYYTNDDPDNAIQAASANRIVFSADIDNDSSPSPVQITWEFQPSKKVEATENKNDRKLIRKVSSGPEAGTTTFAVTDFNLTFYDANGQVIEDNGSATETKGIRSIKVHLVAEAPVRYGSKDYEKSVWNKKFTPPNLNLNSFE